MFISIMFVGLPGSFAYTTAKNMDACGQLSCTSNGILSLLDFSDGSTKLGSCWLCKSTTGHVYAISASHMVDKDDAYFNDINIVSTGIESYFFMSLFSCLNQDTLYILTTSNNVEVLPIFIAEYTNPNTQQPTLGILTLDNLYNSQYVNLSSDRDLGSKQNNILNYLFGNNNQATNTGFSFVSGNISNVTHYAVESANNSASNNYSMMSIDLNPIVTINSSQVQVKILASLSFYGNNNDKLYFMTEGQKLPRWTEHLLDDLAFFINDIENNNITIADIGILNILNKGLISGNFMINGKNYLIPMSVIGGDHRSDISIMRPNFNAINILNSLNQGTQKITQEVWDLLPTINIEDISVVHNGDAVCNIGNPYYLNKSSVNGGFLRAKYYNDTSYVPYGSMIANTINLGGVSGAPELSTKGNVIGMATFGFTSASSGDETSISGGPNCKMIQKIFSDVTNTFENSYLVNSIIIPQTKYQKNYFGADYYGLDLSYITQILGSFFVPNLELTGFVLDNVNNDGLLYSLGLRVGDVLLGATYTELNDNTQKHIYFGTKPWEYSLADVIYNKKINTIQFNYIQGSNGELLESDAYLSTNVYTLTNNDTNYPIYADYYFGDTATSYTQTSYSGNSTIGKINYFYEKKSVNDVSVKKMIAVNNSKDINNISNITKNSKNFVVNKLLEKSPTIKSVVDALSPLNIKDWNGAKQNFNLIVNAFTTNIDKTHNFE